MAQAAKTIAVSQSCYIPGKGLLDLVDRCDGYVILDSIQFAGDAQ